MELSDHQLALRLLVDAGATPGDAALALVNDPGFVERSKDQIGALRQRAEAEKARAQEEAFYRTPEGIELAALAAGEAEERQAKVHAGLRAQLGASGISTEGMTVAELEHVTGLRKSPELMSLQEKDEAQEALAASPDWHRLSSSERLERAQAVGADTISIDRYRGRFLGLPLPEGSEGGEQA